MMRSAGQLDLSRGGSDLTNRVPAYSKQHAWKTPARCWRGRAFASSGSSGEEFVVPRLVPKRQRADWSTGPNFELSWKEAVEMQLQALKDNNTPSPDTGIEVLYRFADIDPWKRSRYFGRSLDLGQFERFRRVFHTRQYALLLCHVDHELRNELQVGEDRMVQRVLVTGYRQGEQGYFDFTMVRRLGGRYDGFWFTQSLICDALDEAGLIV